MTHFQDTQILEGDHVRFQDDDGVERFGVVTLVVDDVCWVETYDDGEYRVFVDYVSTEGWDEDEGGWLY